jgi:hypothetical protein
VSVIVIPGGGTTDNFEGYATGSLPTEWGTDWGDHTWTVEEESSNNVLESLSGSSTAFCLWDDFGTIADVEEVTCRGRLASGLNAMRLCARVSGSSGSEYLYMAEINTAANQFNLRKIVNGSYTTLATTSQSFAAATWYYLRLSVVGDLVRASWGATLNDAEASWVHEETDTSVTVAGKIAVSYGAGGSSQECWFDDLRVTAQGTGTAGTLEVTGYDPTVNVGVIVVPKSIDDLTAGVLRVAGYDPVVGVLDIVHPFGTLGITGYDPEVLAALEVTSGLGTLEITGYDPTVVLVVPTEPGFGALEIEGYNPVVTATDSTLVDLYFKFKDSTGNVRVRQILVRPPVTEATTTYTIANTEEIVLANAVGGAFTATMPSAVGREGYVYSIKKTDSSANAVKVDGLGSEEIDGDADFDLLSQDEVITVVSDNANWWII